MPDLNLLCIPVLLLVGLGLQRVRGSRRALETFVIFLPYPALMLTEAMRLEFKLASASLFSLVYLSGCFLWSWLTSRGLPEVEAKTVVFNSTFLNSLFLPFPLIYAFYGDLSAAVLFSLPVMVIHNTLGPLYLSTSGGRETLRKVASFPPLLAFLVGMLLHPLGWGGKSFELLHGFGKLTVYLSLLLVGLYLPLSRRSLFFFSNRAARRIFLNRMVFSPLFVLAFLPFFSDQLLRNTLLVNSLMPPAITNAVLISSFGLDTESTSQSLFLPTFLSLGAVFALRALGLL
jgi:predicted permease